MNSLYMTVSFAGGSLAALLIGGFSDWMGINDTFFYATIMAALAIPFTFMLPGEKSKVK
jgi:fucose permease